MVGSALKAPDWKIVPLSDLFWTIPKLKQIRLVFEGKSGSLHSLHWLDPVTNYPMTNRPDSNLKKTSVSDTVSLDKRFLMLGLCFHYKNLWTVPNFPALPETTHPFASIPRNPKQELIAYNFLHHNVLPLRKHTNMQTTPSRAPDCQTAVEILSDLISREEDKWPWTSTGSDMYPTNAEALHYVLSLNEFRLREVDNIVVLGLGDLGTVEQQHANYANQALAADQRDTQNAAFMQLGIAQIIRDYIRTVLRNHAPVNLYVCDQGFTRSMNSILGELEFPVIERSDLPEYINQYSLVYDVTMEAGELQRAVDFSVRENMVAPAAVITHMGNGALDT